MSWRLVTSSLKMDKMLFRTMKSGRIMMLTNRGARKLSLQNNPVLSDVLENFMNWCSKPPKGFEKFFRDKPKAGEKVAAPKREKVASEGGSSKKEIPRPNLSKPKSSNPSEDFQELFKKISGGGGGSGGGGMNDQDKQKWQQLIGLGVVTVIGLGLLAQSRYREISWKEFVETHLSRGTVERLEVINSKWVKVILKAGGMDSEVIWFSIGSPDRFERNLEAAQNELGIEAARSVPVLYKTRMEMSDLFSFIPTLLLIGFLVWSMRRAGSMMGGMGGGGRGGRGGGMFGGMMQSTAKTINPSEINVAFKDVAGCEEAKIEIMEFVNFLKNPGQYTDLGAKIPKGAILTGPPGTGKTLIAKATAGEANVPFLSVSGSEFLEMFVGVGPARVRYY